VIAPELRRIVEFLDDQMDKTQVLALEVKQYIGTRTTTLVPRIVGQSIKAQDKKQTSARSGTTHQWDEPEFMEEIRTRCGDQCVTAVQEILKWAAPLGVLWGKGNVDGSLSVYFDNNTGRYWTFIVYTTAPRIEIQFQYMKNKPPFNSEELRRALADRLNEIPGISPFGDGDLGRRPTFPLALLANDHARRTFLAAFDWYISTIRTHIAP